MKKKLTWLDHKEADRHIKYASFKNTCILKMWIWSDYSNFIVEILYKSVYYKQENVLM